MSFVTNVILTCSEYTGEGRDAEILAKLNEYNSGYTCPSFASVGQHAAGPKYLEADVFLGAFNYLDESKLWAFLRSFPWEFPESVAVFVKRQDDESFRPWQRYLATGVDEDGETVRQDVTFAIGVKGEEP
jgi:hypothetical protein